MNENGSCEYSGKNYFLEFYFGFICLYQGSKIGNLQPQASCLPPCASQKSFTKSFIRSTNSPHNSNKKLTTIVCYRYTASIPKNNNNSFRKNNISGIIILCHLSIEHKNRERNVDKFPTTTIKFIFQLK